MTRSEINKRLNSRISCMSRRYDFCKINQALAKRFRGAVRSKIGRALSPWKHLPYTVDELRTHLEAQFVDGMNWEEMELWHIDHIRPVASFEFTSFDDSAFQECFALTNLRPMWASDNSRKGAKWFDPKIYPTLFEL